MNPENLPYVGAVFRFGANDRVLDSIMLAGPVVILAMVVLGRTPITTFIAGVYVLSFVSYVIYKGIGQHTSESKAKDSKML